MKCHIYHGSIFNDEVEAETARLNKIKQQRQGACGPGGASQQVKDIVEAVNEAEETKIPASYSISNCFAKMIVMEEHT